MHPLTGSGSLLTMAIGIILQIDTGPNHQRQRSPPLSITLIELERVREGCDPWSARWKARYVTVNQLIIIYLSLPVGPLAATSGTTEETVP